MRALSLVWLLYAALSLILGVAGLTFAHQFFTSHFGHFGRGPWSDGGPPDWLGPAIFRFVWLILLVRTGLAAIAAWDCTSARSGPRGSYCGPLEVPEISLWHCPGILGCGRAAGLPQHHAL